MVVRTIFLRFRKKSQTVLDQHHWTIAYISMGLLYCMYTLTACTGGCLTRHILITRVKKRGRQEGQTKGFRLGIRFGVLNIEMHFLSKNYISIISLGQPEVSFKMAFSNCPGALKARIVSLVRSWEPVICVKLKEKELTTNLKAFFSRWLMILFSCAPSHSSSSTLGVTCQLQPCNPGHECSIESPLNVRCVLGV